MSTAISTYTEEQLDFRIGSPCISSAQKFILPIPQLSDGGEPLVYPDRKPNGDPDTENAGHPVVDWKGEPIGERGIVFPNDKDNSWQAAPGNGEAVIIMNQVDETQAQNLDNYIHNTLQHRRGEDFTFTELKNIIEYARTDLEITDMYNSDTGFISDKMSRVGLDTGTQNYGLYKRDDRDICQAIFIPYSGNYKGPAASAQEFTDGAVIITQPGAGSRLVQPRIFQETYKNPDGSIIDLNNLAMFYKADPDAQVESPISIIAGLVKAYDRITLHDLLLDLPNTVRQAYRYHMPEYTTLDAPQIRDVKTATVGAFTICHGMDKTRSREPLVVIIEREDGKLGAIGGYINLGADHTGGEQPNEGAVRKLKAEAVGNDGTPIIAPDPERLDIVHGGTDYRIAGLPVAYYGFALELGRDELKSMDSYRERLSTDQDYKSAVSELNLGELSAVKIMPISKALELDRDNFTHPHEYDAIEKLQKRFLAANKVAGASRN